MTMAKTAPMRKASGERVRLNLLAVFLFALVLSAGVGPIHHVLHLEAEKDDPTHVPLACPECQSLKTLSSIEPQSFADMIDFPLEETSIVDHEIGRCDVGMTAFLLPSRGPPLQTIS
jgi:hypothetical protein